MATTRRRRFGRVRKLPSGRYQVRYHGPDGTDRPAPYTFRTKSEADVWLAETEADINRGRWIDPDAGQMTVGEWAERWFASVSPQLKVKTRATYASLLRSTILLHFEHVSIAAIRPIMVSEWVAKLLAKPLSASRVRQSYRLLSQIMAAAVNNEMINASPCRGVKLPRMPETEPHILTRIEVDRLIAALPEPHDLLVQLLAFGGLRIGEAFAVRRRDIDLNGGRLYVRSGLVEISGRHTFDTPKSHQCRVVTLPQFVLKRLRRHLAELAEDGDTLLFVGRTGRPLHYNSWRRTRFDPAVTMAGLEDVTPHDLRASHASWVADKRGVMAAANRLGHSNASVTTRHYARAMDGRDADIARDLDAETTVEASTGADDGSGT